MTLTWIFIGMVVGLFAAERKKFNLLAGAVVGALLGPFSVLMFFASGPKMRVCPYCAEKVLPEAKWAEALDLVKAKTAELQAA